MTLLRAVGRFYGRYAQFGGRAGRAEFWWVVLYLSLASLGITLLFGALGADTTTAAPSAVVFPGFAVSGLSVPAVDSMTEAYQAFSGVWGLLHLVPAWALTARRLHDAGLSRAWLILALLPVLGAIALLVMVLQPSDPRVAAEAAAPSGQSSTT